MGIGCCPLMARWRPVHRIESGTACSGRHVQRHPQRLLRRADIRAQQFRPQRRSPGVRHTHRLRRGQEESYPFPGGPARITPGWVSLRRLLPQTSAHVSSAVRLNNAKLHPGVMIRVDSSKSLIRSIPCAASGLNWFRAPTILPRPSVLLRRRWSYGLSR